MVLIGTFMQRQYRADLDWKIDFKQRFDSLLTDYMVFRCSIHIPTQKRHLRGLYLGPLTLGGLHSSLDAPLVKR